MDLCIRREDWQRKEKVIQISISGLSTWEWMPGVNSYAPTSAMKSWCSPNNRFSQKSQYLSQVAWRWWGCTMLRAGMCQFLGWSEEVFHTVIYNACLPYTLAIWTRCLKAPWVRGHNWGKYRQMMRSAKDTNPALSHISSHSEWKRTVEACKFVSCQEETYRWS